MKISFSTVPGNLSLDCGYGQAGFRIVRSLQELGHKVPFQDKTAKVQLQFSQPHHKKFFRGQYKIMYTPWESTELPDEWAGLFNECDEVWTTSPLMQSIFQNEGVTKPVHVYQHGLDKIWTYKERDPNPEVVKFLHVGAPAVRKHADIAVDAFRVAFGNRTDVSLTLKAMGTSGLGRGQNYDNVHLIWQALTDRQMVQLYHQYDALVYPTAGEGFGFIPLQGLATGMPVITTNHWAPYEHILDPQLIVDTTWVDSPWEEHPGYVLKPNFDDLVETYRFTADNYYSLTNQYGRAKVVAKEYDWKRLTEQAFEPVVERFGDSENSFWDRLTNKI